MTLDFRDAVRQDVQLLILLAGGTGSGKTESALRLATGIAAGGLIVGIDTERGRMLHKADHYRFKHATLEPPFTPARYAEALRDAYALEPAVVVLDSGSHEYDGEGGVLDIQEDEFERFKRRESARMASWIKPKREHKVYLRELLRAPCHVIVCHRAEDKVEPVKKPDGQGGERTEIVPKKSYIGADGWIPICEKRLPFEATMSFLVTVAEPGVPVPIKLEGDHVPLIPLDQKLSEDTGRRLAEWAAGSKTAAQGRAPVGDDGARENDTGTGGSTTREEALEQRRVTLTGELLEFAKAKKMLADGERWVEENRHLNKGAPAKHLVWLEEQIKVAKRNAQAAA